MLYNFWVSADQRVDTPAEFGIRNQTFFFFFYPERNSVFQPRHVTSGLVLATKQRECAQCSSITRVFTVMPWGGLLTPPLDLQKSSSDQSAAQKPWTSPPPPHPLPSLPCTPPSAPLPPLVCATFHPLILLLFLSSSIPRSSMLRWGLCLISLPVHPIARSARPTLVPRRGGARPHHQAHPPRPARRGARRGKCDLFLPQYQNWSSSNLEQHMYKHTRPYTNKCTNKHLKLALLYQYPKKAASFMYITF